MGCVQLTSVPREEWICPLCTRERDSALHHVVAEFSEEFKVLYIALLPTLFYC